MPPSPSHLLPLHTIVEWMVVAGVDPMPKIPNGVTADGGTTQPTVASRELVRKATDESIVCQAATAAPAFSRSKRRADAPSLTLGQHCYKLV